MGLVFLSVLALLQGQDQEVLGLPLTGLPVRASPFIHSFISHLLGTVSIIVSNREVVSDLSLCSKENRNDVVALAILVVM